MKRIKQNKYIAVAAILLVVVLFWGIKYYRQIDLRRTDQKQPIALNVTEVSPSDADLAIALSAFWESMNAYELAKVRELPLYVRSPFRTEYSESWKSSVISYLEHRASIFKIESDTISWLNNDSTSRHPNGEKFCIWGIDFAKGFVHERLSTSVHVLENISGNQIVIIREPGEDKYWGVVFDHRLRLLSFISKLQRSKMKRAPNVFHCFELPRQHRPELKYLEFLFNIGSTRIHDYVSLVEDSSFVTDNLAFQRYLKGIRILSGTGKELYRSINLNTDYRKYSTSDFFAYSFPSNDSLPAEIEIYESEFERSQRKLFPFN